MDAKRPLKSESTVSYTVILKLVLNEFTVGEIAKSPTLPQAKVNKCLIALVGAKAANKTTEGVSILCSPLVGSDESYAGGFSLFIF
jgi:hypothetical protein